MGRTVTANSLTSTPQPIPWIVRGGRALTVSAPFGVMGIVNLTPDSFHDGGQHNTPLAGVDHALKLLAEGADILDLGAESSRPGARPIAAAEEQHRLLPVLTGLRAKAPAAVISVDTWRASTAVMALEAGAAIINDISACADPDFLDVLAQYRPGYVLMHGRGFPADKGSDVSSADICREVMEFFEAGLQRLTAAGLPEERIVLDPGIGFGKSQAQNLLLLAGAGQWQSLGRPVLLGLSMKSLFGGLLGLPTAERGPATQVASALLWSKGVFWHRVHDV
ncbi:MAG: dihydropteroate synthase, partial [Desulfovibrionaceae bacterium]|nr:dihydropteroate synthase [Desulfovibrionaceae bacterium]